MPFTPSGARVVSGHERACQRDQQDPCECLLPRAERGWCHSVSTFKSLSIAMAKGFYRDRATVFFSFLFPLMFLVVFGLIFRDAGAQKIKIGVVGDGPVITALTLVSWRKKQVLRRLRLAPVAASTLLTSRIAVTIGIAVVQALIFIGIGLLPVFGLQLTGTWWMAIPVFLLGILAFFSIGMVVGAFAKTEQAATGAANIVVLPMAFLSGTFFPIDQAPAWLRTVSQVFPLRHMNDGIMDFLVRGKAASALLVPCAVLLGFTLVLGTIAAKGFQWED